MLPSPNKLIKENLVSVVVPTRNSALFLETCLISIIKQTYKNIDLIVVDNNSTDNTKEIAKKYTDKVFNKGPERSVQRNYGANKSSGNYLVFIDSDMQLSSKVVEQCVNTMHSNKDISAVVIPEKSVGIGFWAQCKALERSFYVGVGWIEAARFFKENVFNQLGGYDEINTGTEDYDLPQRIIKTYGEKNIGRISEYIIHNEGRLSLLRLLLKKMYYGKNLSRYSETNTTSFSVQSSLNNRFYLFFSNPKRLFNNPALGIGMLIMKSLEFSFGGLGYLLSKFKFNRKSITHIYN